MKNLIKHMSLIGIVLILFLTLVKVVHAAYQTQSNTVTTTVGNGANNMPFTGSTNAPVSVIGDSITVGVQNAGYFKTSLPNANFIDAQVSRPWSGNGTNPTSGITALKSHTDIEPILVFALGTNGGITDAKIQELLSSAPEGTKFVLMTLAGSGGNLPNYRDSSNQVVAKAAQQYAGRIWIADWHAQVSAHPEYLGPDSIHPSSAGQKAFATMIAQAVENALRASSTTPTSATTPQPSPPQPISSDIDTIIQKMSVDEKIGQLFMLGFQGTDASGATVQLRDLKAGGIILMGGNTNAAATAKPLIAGINQIARANGLPTPLISVDQEGGVVTRIKSGVTQFPNQWVLGQESLNQGINDATYRGTTQGKELKALGFSMNNAPVLDIWDNPNNTVIGERSYSSDPDRVAQLGVAYIKALQAQGVLAVGKHFPGHGSTTNDTHKGGATDTNTRAHLESNELVPFKAAVANGVDAIMVAHVTYPALDPSTPASLSKAIVDGLLRASPASGGLGFDGIAITDDMGMGALSGYGLGERAVMAITAGEDMIISIDTPSNQKAMINAVKAAYNNHQISDDRLNASLRRILTGKKRAGLL